ncbi:integrase, catalytic region, zinc finger, CCHC-type containing protein [Tanacetum coccineum]
MSKNKDRYHDTILDLEAKLKKNVDLILKLGNSLQGMFMLGPKPLSVYDPQLKHGLGYPNPYTLKQAISQCPKLYLASTLSKSEILEIRDTEDTLDDTSKSMEKLENENVSLEFQVQSLIKERDNTSHDKQRGANSNKNVIALGMYKVVTTQESQTNEAKRGLSSTRINVASSVRRPMNKDSHVKNSVLANSKNSAKKVPVYVRKNKQTDKTSANVILNKENVIDVNVANAPKAKTLLCVSCMQNVVEIVLWIVDSGCSKHMTGLGHNLFSVGQFCDGDLEVAFRSKTCYVRNLEGDDLLIGGRESNFYTIYIYDMAASSPVCLMSKATSTKSWLWHRRLSHLNFGTINDLTKLDLVDGLPKFKYGNDHLCLPCEEEITKSSISTQMVPSGSF